MKLENFKIALTKATDVSYELLKERFRSKWSSYRTVVELIEGCECAGSVISDLCDWEETKEGWKSWYAIQNSLFGINDDVVENWDKIEMKKVHGEIIYTDEKNEVVHSDMYLHDNYIKNNNRQFYHDCLDEWLDKSNGTGIFYLREEGFEECDIFKMQQAGPVFKLMVNLLKEKYYKEFNADYSHKITEELDVYEKILTNLGYDLEQVRLGKI